MPTTTELLSAAERLRFQIPESHKEDYLQLLAKTDEACELVLAQPDYKPSPDFEKFPRENVHLPANEDNALRGWAWRAEAGDSLEAIGKLLNGKTVVFKDTVCMAQVPLLFGTDAFENFIPDIDATVVTRVLENGGHILGKAACENFSHGASSSSSPYGPVENPYAKGFSAGGSSSGCGALISSGAADMGIGGDQGGSIRIPASLCGIVGLKPTFGLVPYTGVLSSEAAADHVGPMAKTVLDTAKLLQAVAGYDNWDDRQLGAPLPSDIPDYVEAVFQSRGCGLHGMKVGILKEPLESASLSPLVHAKFKASIDRLQELGAEVTEVSVPLQSMTTTLVHVLNKFGSGGTRQGRQVGRRGLQINGYWGQLLPWTQEKYDKAKYFVTGTAMSCEYGWMKYPTAYGRAMNLALQMRDQFDALFENLDVIVMPTLPQPARRHIAWDSSPAEWAKHAPGITSNTGTFNLTGHPALTVPIGLVPPMAADITCPEDESIRLPVGIQIVGKRFDEITVLKVGDALEQGVDWKLL